MKINTSYSDNKLWLSIGEKTYLIDTADDLNRAIENLDHKCSTKVIKSVHAVRSASDARLVSIPKIILSTALLVGVFWIGSSNMYSLQALNSLQKPVTANSAPISTCQPERSSKIAFENTQATESLEQSLRMAKTAATKFNDSITDEIMDNTFYDFGYN